MSSSENIRKIIHIDMDAFYASVEQRDFPGLRNRPIAVGGSSMRGVVAAASYEARKFGVHSAMSSVQAKKLCPQLIFVKGRMDVYKEVSSQVREIFNSYTELVEPLSLDEAYLDVSVNKKNINSAMKIALQIKNEIKVKTQLTASAGISFNKFLAKTASGMNKPDGFTVILPNEAERFLEKLPIEKFYGIGKVTARKMHEAGIANGFDLKNKSLAELVKRFGKIGKFYYNIVRAKDDRSVNSERIRKSISIERTFAENLRTKEELLVSVAELSEKLYLRMQKSQSYGQTLTLKIKYEDFSIHTRNSTAPLLFRSLEQIILYAQSLLVHVDLEHHQVRLLGIGISSLDGQEKQKIGNQLSFEF
ncbi:DNA polymerase-4 [Catalinimonas alkaloidigena]|uniref:DNA polymerase IV n=1 Tax=Catalinimonas alkaloidigena TaxID=1075417 RepID=UPI00240737E7|nr:DNA polymerase IV [Catalinimonas alkaloidigena]MDF9797665.1 DNA polymerase-4 [Catalinimonas alkaloidigena]